MNDNAENALNVLNNGDVSIASKFQKPNKEWDQFCTSLCEEVHKLDECTPQQGQNLADFMSNIEMIYRVDLWTKLLEPGLGKLRLIKSLHRPLAPHVMGALPTLRKLDPHNKGVNEALTQFHNA